MINSKNFRSFSTYFLAKEAENRGIKVEQIFKSGFLAKKSVLELSYKGKKEIIIGQRTSKTDCIASGIQQNKELAKFFFRRAGINVAKSRVFSYKDINDIIKYCHLIKYPVVLKPLYGTQGANVYLGLDSDDKVKKALKSFGSGFYSTVLVEKEFSGKEYRLFATREKFIAATLRVPANVNGDGTHSIAELIKIKNKDQRRGLSHEKSLVRIKIDEAVKNYLKSNKLSLSSVPKKNKVVYLRPNSNLSTGGDSYDYTDIMNPAVKKLAVKVIRAVPGLAYAGIDYLTKDIASVPTKRNYIIIEVNNSPMISMHHLPFEGKERNAAGAIIDQIFPGTISKK